MFVQRLTICQYDVVANFKPSVTREWLGGYTAKEVLKLVFISMSWCCEVATSGSG